MMKTLFAFVLIVASIDLAVAQGAAGTKRPEYATAAQALQGLRAKPGVKISVQSGWTVIEDRSTLSIWSFPPAGHRAYPTAIQRKVVQEGCFENDGSGTDHAVVADDDGRVGAFATSY